MKILLLLICMLTCVTVKAQTMNMLFVQGKGYPTTPLLPLNFDGQHDLDLTVAKISATQGIVSLKFGTEVEGFRIEKQAVINLMDGKTVTLTNIISYDHIDGETVTNYSIGIAEIIALRNKMVHSVRFTTACTSCSPQIPSQVHLAKNDFSNRTDVDNYLGRDNSGDIQALFAK